MRMVRISRIRDEKYYADKIELNFSNNILLLIAQYILSDSTLINRSSLNNVRKLFKMMDDRVYNSDIYKKVRFRFIKRLLKNKLDNYISNFNLLLEASVSNMDRDIEELFIDEIKRSKELTSPDIKYINSLICDKLEYSFFYKYKKGITESLNKIDSGEYVNFKDISKELRKELSSLLGDIRKVNNRNTIDEVFSLEGDLFENSVVNTVETLRNPSAILDTGIQWLNDSMAGGLHGSRVYTILGLSGSR